MHFHDGIHLVSLSELFSANCSINNIAHSQQWLSLNRSRLGKMALELYRISFHLLWCRCSLLLLVSPWNRPGNDAAWCHKRCFISCFCWSLDKHSVDEEVEAGELWGSSRSHMSSWEGTCVWWWFCVMFPFILHDTHSVIVSWFISKTLGWRFQCGRTCWLFRAGTRKDLCTFTTIRFHCWG